MTSRPRLFTSVHSLDICMSTCGFTHQWRCLRSVDVSLHRHCALRPTMNRPMTSTSVTVITTTTTYSLPLLALFANKRRRWRTQWQLCGNDYDSCDQFLSTYTHGGERDREKKLFFFFVIVTFFTLTAQHWNLSLPIHDDVVRTYSSLRFYRCDVPSGLLSNYYYLLLLLSLFLLLFASVPMRSQYWC